MNDTERAIKKLRSADSYHTQKQYNLDDETIDMAITALEKQIIKKPALNEIEKALAYLNDSLKYAEKTDNANEVKNILNTAISALEKQMPKKVDFTELNYQKLPVAKCPSCQSKDIQNDYCPDCGQKLDWVTDNE